jgi:hypothetical protein
MMIADAGTISPEMLGGLGIPSQNVAQPSQFLPVATFGQGSCFTTCTIVGVGQGVTVDYGGKQYNFIEQIFLTCGSGNGSNFDGNSGADIITAIDNCREPVGVWEGHFVAPPSGEFPAGFQQYPNLGIAWVTSQALDYFQMAPSGGNDCTASGVAQTALIGAPAVSSVSTAGEPSPNVPSDQRGTPGIASFPYARPTRATARCGGQSGEPSIVP